MINVAVGVLTHEAIRHDRIDLLKRTLKSLTQTDIPFTCYVVDNHSTDGTQDYVASIGGFCSRDPNTTCGHGMNLTIGACAEDSDLVVFSNDDIDWKPGYLETLVAFWSEAPDDLLVCSGHLEPEYQWNTPRGVIECGGVRALVRDTAPGGTWTLRSRDWPRIGPVPEQTGWDDVPTCRRLKAQGFRVAQMDVAEHVGDDFSTWGNRSIEFAQPLDKEKWGLLG